GNVARGAVVHRPAAVVALVVADVLRDAAPDLLVPGAEKVREEQVLGIHRGVRFQLPPPVPFRVLLALEPPLRALDDKIESRALDPGPGPDHDAPRRRSRLRSSNQRTAFASASRMGVCRKPSSRTAR